MFQNLNSLNYLQEINCDYCIVGSGPAGITLANSLDKKYKIVLCEAGDFLQTDSSTDCYKGEVIGDPYFELDVCRLRQFGGTSGHWGGWSRTLDDVDFVKKNLNKLAYWPIEKKDLDIYLDEALPIINVETIPQDEIMSKEFGIKKVYFKYSETENKHPTRFGEKYKKKILDSKNIHLYINSNLTKVLSEDQVVTEAHFKSFNKKNLKVKAKVFIFAMGGIENSRQLAWQQIQNNKKLYPSNLPVGRYWIEHPHYSIGEILLSNKVNLSFFTLTKAKQLEKGVMSCALRVHGQKLSKTKDLARDLLCKVPNLSEKFIYNLKKNLLCSAHIETQWEQSPEFSNKISLSNNQRDFFNIPRPVLNWTKVDLDYITVKETLNQFNQWILSEDLGRIKMEEWLLDENYKNINLKEKGPFIEANGGNHHMGGTRMANDPNYGVVDKNCKVHGSKNLYMAGSSVFPTGGYSNPTLTIVQLSLRLANYFNNMKI